MHKVNDATWAFDDAAVPFATFNTQIPGAVAKAVARNPARIEAANRASGDALLGGDAQLGDKKARLYAPSAEVGRAIGDPLSFARKSAADPVRALASIVGLSANDRKKYFTYGLDPWTQGGATKILLNMAAPGKHRHRHSMIESVPSPRCRLCAGTRVLRTAVRVAVIYRRRECSACGHRYSTHETIGARRYTVNTAG